MAPKEKPSWKIPKELKAERTGENSFYPLLLILEEYRETKKKLEKEGQEVALESSEISGLMSKAVYEIVNALPVSISERLGREILISKILENLPEHGLVAHPPNENKVFQAVIDGLASLRDLKIEGLPD